MYIIKDLSTKSARFVVKGKSEETFIKNTPNPDFWKWGKKKNAMQFGNLRSAEIFACKYFVSGYPYQIIDVDANKVCIPVKYYRYTKMTWGSKPKAIKLPDKKIMYECPYCKYKSLSKDIINKCIYHHENRFYYSMEQLWFNMKNNLRKTNNCSNCSFIDSKITRCKLRTDREFAYNINSDEICDLYKPEEK